MNKIPSIGYKEIMRYISLVLMTLLLVFIHGCTLTISVAATHGTASDVIDDTSTVSPQVSASLTKGLK